MNLLTTARRNGLTVTIIANEKGTPPGKLADAELVFRFDVDDENPNAWERVPAGMPSDAYRCAELLNGLRLTGFAIWERRNGGGRNVTFPARTYAVNGERRSFALLRPTETDPLAGNRVRDLILAAYEQHELAAAWNSPDTRESNGLLPTTDAPTSTPPLFT